MPVNQKMKNIKVRYGPSPTGVPHIGNVRTALFNFLFAKSQKGQFLLRIEDTDQARIVQGAVKKIQESLKLLNLEWDGEIIFQSKRLEIYKKHLEILKEKKLAYEESGAWRFKVQTSKPSISWQDIVHGEVTFPTKVLEDFIIIKSDGFPTYHFASVVDDHLMEISHVLRGDEWISSTPKHILLYEAFGWSHPYFVHLPPILGAEHKKLSKRDGAKSVMEYINEGYLPEALINFMVLLGWSPKSNQEIFSLEDLSKEFSLDRINKNSPVFNTEKLNWFNGQWIRKVDVQSLAALLSKRFPDYEKSKIIDICPIVKDRMTLTSDFQTLAGFLFENKIQINPKQVILSKDELQKLTEAYKNISPNNWNKVNISSATVSMMEEQGLSKPETFSSIGVAVSGSKVTPPIFDTLEKLGQEKTIKRLEDVIKFKK